MKSLPRFGRTLGLLAAASLVLSAAGAAAQPNRYPGANWDELAPSQSGWSAQHLKEAEDYARQIGSTAIVVVQHGVVIESWGDIGTNLLLNSTRKSLLSALMGIAVAKRQVDLDATLTQLGIDDVPPSLTAGEKQATVRDLLKARSGVYHAANYETKEMVALRPSRGSHPPDTFWFYNNWDFNALGAIYEHATGVPIFAAFAQQIAKPIGMQDFDPALCRYSGGPDSHFPAYLFYASARDLARFGLLFLRQGRWRDTQIVPAAWVQESTRAYSITARKTGYAYLWWTLSPEGPSRVAAPPGTFWAEGNGGQIVFVVPAYDTVVVHLARGRDGLPGTSVTSALHLMELVLAAHPGG